MPHTAHQDVVGYGFLVSSPFLGYNFMDLPCLVCTWTGKLFRCWPSETKSSQFFSSKYILIYVWVVRFSVARDKGFYEHMGLEVEFKWVSGMVWSPIYTLFFVYSTVCSAIQANGMVTHVKKEWLFDFVS